MRIRRDNKLIPPFLKWFIRCVIGAAAFFGIAFLPGTLEGSYRGFGSCACDSISFENFRSGKMITYHTEHPPAEIWGSYREGNDGGVEIYFRPLREGHKSEHVMNAYPHFLLTRFVSVPEGTSTWHWKCPLFGDTSKAFKEQEIVERVLDADNVLVTEHFDHDFTLLRTERKLPLPKPDK